MSNSTTKIGVEVDPETDGELGRWKVAEGRSKRRHAAILLRKLCELRRTPVRELLRLPAEDVLRRIEVLQ